MKIIVELRLDSPYELSNEQIEDDLRKSEDQIGWDFDYSILSVKVVGNIKQGNSCSGLGYAECDECEMQCPYR